MNNPAVLKEIQEIFKDTDTVEENLFMGKEITKKFGIVAVRREQISRPIYAGFHGMSRDFRGYDYTFGKLSRDFEKQKRTKIFKK